MRASPGFFLVAAFTTGLVLSSGYPSSAQFDAPSLDCRSAVAKSGSKLTRAVLKGFTTCHKSRYKDGDLAATDCNDPADADLNGKIGSAEAKFTKDVTADCADVDPAAVLYLGCPAPCATTVPSITTFADVAACMVCLDGAKLERFANWAYRTPASPLADSTDAGCHRSITQVSAKLVSSIVKQVAKCQASDEKDGAVTIDHCTDEIYLELVNDSFSDALAKLSNGGCAGATLPGDELDACGGVTSAVDLAYCVLDSARSYAQQISAAYLELPETAPTTTTSSTTTTTTTHPPGDPQCPNTAEIVLHARETHAVCTTNDDCDAPRTCSLGACTPTVTERDLGWNGIGHRLDFNDGARIEANVYCAGPAAPGCGECSVIGADSVDNCRCRNSDQACGDLSSSSGDCPACDSGVLAGQACAEDVDCFAGTCARRCLNNLSHSCVTDADCPGSSCPPTNTRCDNGSHCSTTSDCEGTCTSDSACDCYLGTPTPVSMGGTPLCIVQKLADKISGTIDVDLGASELDLDLRMQIFLGSSVTSPCPVCGGKCSNDPLTLCVADGDCGTGNTCTQDTAADGNRDGICIGGRSHGEGCDVTASNTSFPARAGAPGGGGYSLDCMPTPGANMSGLGLATTSTPTTAGSTLPSTLSCGGDHPGASCPCLVCSGSGHTPCHSDAECASIPHFCSASANFLCDVDADCASVDAGTCTVLGNTRCSLLPSVLCNSNSDCSGVPAGTCGPSTCSSDGGDGFPSPNSCDDGLCSAAGGDKGECTTGPDESYCDGILLADGGGLFACNDDSACSADAVGVDAGHCTHVQRRACFLDTIVASGVADPAFPVTAATYCMPPSDSSTINLILGLPGPAREISQQSLLTYCASNPAVPYEPGVGCP